MSGLTQVLELFQTGGGGGGGGLMGGGAATQVAFWSAATTLAGDNNHWWDNVNKRLGLATTIPASTFHNNGSLSLSKFVTVDVNYNILLSDFYIRSKPNPPAPITITIPLASNALEGKIYLIKDVTGAAAANPITVQCSGIDQLDGAASRQITQNYGTMWIYCAGGAGGIGIWDII